MRLIGPLRADARGFFLLGRLETAFLASEYLNGMHVLGHINARFLGELASLRRVLGQGKKLRISLTAVIITL